MTHIFKKIGCILLCTLLLCSAFPLTGAAAESSSQIFYPVDLSSAVLKCRINMNDFGGSTCTVAAMATVEAYKYYVTSSADKKKVFDAFVAANGGTDYLNSYANVGYTYKASADWTLIYNNLAKGVPSVVYRPAANGKSQHFAIVAGYKGSTTSLDKDAFIMVDVYRGTGGTDILTSKEWRNGLTISKTISRRNGISVTGLSKNIRLSINSPSPIHKQGEGHGVYGYITAAENLTEISVSVINRKTGNNVFAKTVKPNSKSYLFFNLDSEMKFASWSVGEYYYLVNAKTASAELTHCTYFRISNTWPSSAPTKPPITVSYNTNGGSGSISSVSTAFGNAFTIPSTVPTKSGYTFAGWHVKRNDGKYYTTAGDWYTASQISSNNYTKRVYLPGQTHKLFRSWIKTADTATTSLTFEAVWETSVYNVHYWGNSSGKNYMRDSDFKTLDSINYNSRNTDIYTLSLDSGRTEEYGSLKIVGTGVGSISDDMSWRTTTMGNTANDGYIGDNKTMTLSFWAKSSVEGTTFYFRFGYKSADTAMPVTLTTDWKYYTLTFTKDTACGAYIHPYFDRAGTVWISELQLEDGNTATAFVPESGTYSLNTAAPGQTYGNLPTPQRDGYSFKGWYTAAKGGTQITADTAVKNGHINLYAHWQPNQLDIRYNVNGGSCESDEFCVSNGVVTKKADNSTLLQLMTYGNTLPDGLYNAATFGLTRKGYVFAGWSTSANGDTVYDENDNTLTPETLVPALVNGDRSVTLYAVWEPAEECYTTITVGTLRHVGRIAAGEEIDITLTASEALQLNGLSMRLCFDETKLEFVDGAFKNTLAAFDMKAFNPTPAAPETEDAEVWFTAMDTDGYADVRNGEVIAVITLRALTDIDSDISVYSYFCTASSYDSTINDYVPAVTCIDGGVKIVDYIAGDVNLSGTVDLNDATRLFYYINGLVTLDGNALLAADVSENGDINLNDATRLFYNINGTI